MWQAWPLPADPSAGPQALKVFLPEENHPSQPAAVTFHLLHLQKSEAFSQTDSTGIVRSGWPWPLLGLLSPAPEILGLHFSLPMKRAVLLLMEKSCPSPQAIGAEILVVPLKFIAAKDGSQTKAVTTTRPAWPWPPLICSSNTGNTSSFPMKCKFGVIFFQDWDHRVQS